LLDWQKVDTPTIFPMRCVTCPEAHDLLDTHVEILGHGHVYVCKNCARTAARLHGWSKGKEQDRLSNAIDVLKAKDKEIAEYKTMLEEAVTEAHLYGKQVETLRAELEMQTSRVTQLTARMQHDGRALLELVEMGPDAA
jgi:hypothetical protein